MCHRPKGSDMATIEDATKLGLAVEAFLARPPLDPTLNPGIPLDVLRQRMTAQLHHLESLQVLTAEGVKPLLAYVEHGTSLPESPSGPVVLTTESVLTTVVLFLHAVGPGSAFGDMPLALSYVIDAAVDGAAHAGPEGAVTYAAIATTQVLQALGIGGVKPHHLPGGVKPHSTGGVKPHSTGGVKPHGSSGVKP
jgi:hypothetical protein